MNDIVKRENTLFERISYLIEQARKRVSTTVNLAEVYTKYSIGQYIVEDEQQGEYRAQYGKQVLQNLSARLTERFGNGWTVDTLKRCRYFYNVYSLQKKEATVLPFSDNVTSYQLGQHCLPNSQASRSPLLLYCYVRKRMMRL